MKVLIKVILAPICLLGLLILAVLSTFFYKDFWDWRVEAMCERDGGEVIYEKVLLPENKFKLLLDGDGYFHLPRQKEAGPRDEFSSSYDSEVLHNGLFGLTIIRAKYQIVRLHDGKVLAEKINYLRRGGDFPFSASNASHFLCPAFEEGSWYRKVFFEVH